jgi:type III secretory pathway component EscR
MKTAITPTYTFTPANNTINLSGISGFSISLLYAVIDITTGNILYAPGLSQYTPVSVVGTLITLASGSNTGALATDYIRCTCSK